MSDEKKVMARIIYKRGDALHNNVNNMPEEAKCPEESKMYSDDSEHKPSSIQTSQPVTDNQQTQIGSPQMKAEGTVNRAPNLPPVFRRIEQEMGMLQNQMGRGMADIYCQLGEIKNANKERRQVVEHVIIEDAKSGSHIMYVNQDRTILARNLFQNVYGPMNVTVIDFYKYNRRIYIIDFASPGYYVIGDAEKVNQENLFKNFISANVRFNPEIKIKTLKTTLYDNLAHRIRHAESLIRIEGLAGWEDGIFKTADNFGYLKSIDKVPDMPVLKKRLSNDIRYIVFADEYFEILNKINNYSARMLLLTFPYASVLSSLLAEHGIRIPMALNFIITDEGFYFETLIHLLQIFNREKHLAYCVDDSEKNIKRILSETKDETIIFTDAFSNMKNSYKKQKIKNNFINISRYVLGRYGLANGITNQPQVGLVFISDQIIDDSKVYNIYVDENFGLVINDLQKFSVDVVGTVICSFIQFVQNNMDKVCWIIKEVKEQRTDTERFWRIMLELIREFWKIGGFDFDEKVNIEGGFDFLWESIPYETEDIVEIFKMCIRKQMRQWRAADKQNRTHAVCADIFFDQDYIWIPTSQFNAFLKESCLEYHKSEILLKCREAGDLLTDDTGFSRKIQVDGQRFEAYQFTRAAFTRRGYLEIMALAKREEDGNA